jgi:hypothetical protein
MYIITATKGEDELIRRTTTDRTEAQSYHANIMKDIEGLEEGLKRPSVITRIDIMTSQIIYDKVVILQKDIILIK